MCQVASLWGDSKRHPCLTPFSRKRTTLRCNGGNPVVTNFNSLQGNNIMHDTTTTTLSDSLEAIRILTEQLEDADWMPVEQLNEFVTTGIILVHRIQKYDIGAFTDDEVMEINECADLLNHHTREMFTNE